MPESTITIVFRGLMAFHRKGTGPTSLFEIGLLSPQPHHGHPLHIPRINTYKNGVLDSVLFLEGLHPAHRQWRLNVENPLEPVSTDEQGATFDRKTHAYKRDYRWLIDLEDNNEFYGPLKGRINTKLLKPVIQIPSGKFYTRLQSRVMLRKKDGSSEGEFGRVSAAVGCDIRLGGQKATLVVEATGVEIFRFEVDPEGSTLYEISNTPPDTHKPAPGEDHFQHYYDIFTAVVPKYDFEAKSAAPGPSPALCGEIRLSQLEDDL